MGKKNFIVRVQAEYLVKTQRQDRRMICLGSSQTIDLEGKALAWDIDSKQHLTLKEER